MWFVLLFLSFQNLASELKKTDDVKEALTKAFLSTDQEIIESVDGNSGSTAVVALVDSGSDGSRRLWVANAGDARAVLCRNSKGIRLSYDHKPTDEAERQRVLDAGGIIIRNRLGAFLAVSRAFGDTSLKEHGLTAEPFITETVLSSEDTHLILACDGVAFVVVFYDSSGMLFLMKKRRKWRLNMEHRKEVKNCWTLP